MCKHVSIIWRIIGVESIILGIIGKKKENKIPESIIGTFWSIIHLNLLLKFHAHCKLKQCNYMYDHS